MEQGDRPPELPLLVTFETKSPETSKPKNSSPDSGAVLYAAWLAASANDHRPVPLPPLPIDHARVGCAFVSMFVSPDLLTRAIEC